MSTVNALKINKIHMLRYIPDPDNFQIRKIRVCNCFLNNVVHLMQKLSGMTNVNEIRDAFEESIWVVEYPKNIMHVLLGLVSVNCCSDALYKSDYMKVVSIEEMSEECECDMPPRLANCAFYLDNDLSDCEAICFKCRCNLLKFVSVSFHKVKKMSVETIRHDKEFLCSGQKVYEFKVCCCLLDVSYGAIPVIESIDHISGIYCEKLGFVLGEHLFWTFNNGYYVVCCKKFGGLEENLRVECPDWTSVSYFDLHDHNDLCDSCKFTISSFLIKKLHRFVVSKK